VTATNIAVIAAIISAFAAVAAAIISAITNLSLSKRLSSQKIAEFRQIWIEDLREKLAEFCDETFKALVLARNEQDTYHLRIQFLYRYVRLKLNIKEEKHRNLLQAMRETIDHVNFFIERKANEENEDQRIKDFRESTSKLCEIADAILKEEWSRVKKETRA